ncbi:MAG: undecaprenyl phosphate-alpha-L-ara4FN deformylase [Psychromonas sp.]|jgi:undecaprenyl phosphate-alpha-L-ara4FN deformylase|uniref:4-deoxy-4-formamido-L-arabinose- phosphoundecaprenol deformylase n=1 Tax=Psychromonas sp. TaxID=1884585 RepID=UPI0039E4D20A
MKSEKIAKVGLRIDVDTLRGTQLGVPTLLQLLAKYEVLASFFFTVGPDNMGRHLWRLLRPAFFKKMCRSKAASLYGWDILMRGTLWPGPIIGHKSAKIIKQTNFAGHEIGLHAWDHYRWQRKVESMSHAQLNSEITKGYQMLQKILGRNITCSAVAGWRCTPKVLTLKELFYFRYNSDCRGDKIFRPGIGMTPQIPVTLPTYDELIGRQGINQQNYNAAILKQIHPDALNVYTIHAEVEGISCAPMFEQLLIAARQKNIQFVPLIELLDDRQWPIDEIVNLPMAGRDGWISQQKSMRQLILPLYQ